MTLDQWLLVVLGFALLFRYHRSELLKAEERYQKCDEERSKLHNFFYGREGATLTDTGNQTEPVSDVPLTPDEKLRERLDETKRQLKRILKTRPSQLGTAIRNLEWHGRPKLTRVRPRLDPATAAQVKETIGRNFANIEDQVKNGRPTQAGG